MALAPEVLADSLGDYLRAWWKRIRGGESGALPIIAGLIVICVFFDVQSSAFLTATNIVNLFVQATFIILLGMGELYALILSEVDLSVAFVGAVGAAIALALITSPSNWPWWAGLIVGLAACAVIGAFQGAIITRLKIPSFVVTLAGLLGWQGVLIYVFDVDKGAVGGVITLPSGVIADLVSGSMTPVAGWIVLVIGIGLYALATILTTGRRRAQGLSAPPLGITVATIGAVALSGIVLVWICNLNRGVLTPVKGVPWVIPFLVVLLIVQSFQLTRTRLGRYIYAIGASPEAARRAGIHVARVRTIAFALCSFTSGLAVVVYASRLGSLSVGFDGGTLRPLCHCGCRHRWGKPVRRIWQAHSPAPGRSRHRHPHQWTGVAQHQHGRNRHRDCCRPARRRRRRRHTAPQGKAGLSLRIRRRADALSGPRARSRAPCPPRLPPAQWTQ